MSEAQEIPIGQEMDPQIQREMGVYDDPSCSVRRATSACRSRADRSGRICRGTSRSSISRRSTRSRCRAASSTSRAASCRSSTTKRSWPACSATRSATSRRATPRSSTRKSIGAQLGLASLGIFVPAARRFGQLAQSGLGLLFLKYGRDDELQADQLGAQIRGARLGSRRRAGMLRRSGGSTSTATASGVPNWLSTHPQPADRVQRIDGEIAHASRRARATDSSRPIATAILRRIDGIIYGDNPSRASCAATSSCIRPLRFRVDFPDGWEVQNSPTQVVAKAPGARRLHAARAGAEAAGREPAGDRARRHEARRLPRACRAAHDDQRPRAFVGMYQGSMQSLGAGRRARRPHPARHARSSWWRASRRPTTFDRPTTRSRRASARSAR